MALYERKDHFYRRAKVEGRVSRASFKIEEIQAKYFLIKYGNKIIDLGCSPGGWLQQLARCVGPTGRVIGIDPVAIRIALPPNVQVLETTIEDVISLPLQVTSLLGGRADLVLSDMAPHTTGVKFQDSYRSYELAGKALQLCFHVLTSGGSFIVKIFAGPEEATLRKQLKASFQRVIGFTPKATRSGSRELYLIATLFCPDKKRPVI